MGMEVSLLCLLCLIAVARLHLSDASKSLECQDELPPRSLLTVEVLHKPATCHMTVNKKDRLQVHYVGKYYSSCEVFDSSRERNTPFEFTLDEEQVIEGWENGIVGMCVGEVRRLTIPHYLSYKTLPGKRAPGIIYDIELLTLHKK
jgi:FK506-binding protein 2